MASPSLQRWSLLQLPVVVALGASTFLDSISGRLAVGTLALVAEAALAWRWLGAAANDDDAIRLAGQVIHDLRPPITALEHVAPSLTSLPDTQQRLIKTATLKLNELIDRLQKARSDLRGENQKPAAHSSNPKAQASGPLPELKSIALTRETLVVVADDDSDIHEAWKQRFSEAAPQVELRFFSRPGDFTDFVTEDPVASSGRPILYLVDHDFHGYTVTGASLVESLNLASQSILVTNRSDDPEVLRTCSRLSLRLLPKTRLRSVSILV